MITFIILNFFKIMDFEVDFVFLNVFFCFNINQQKSYMTKGLKDMYPLHLELQFLTSCCIEFISLSLNLTLYIFIYTYFC